MKIRIEKLQKELSRGSAAEQHAVLIELRGFVVSNLSKERERLQAHVFGVQSLINDLASEVPLDSQN